MLQPILHYQKYHSVVFIAATVTLHQRPGKGFRQNYAHNLYGNESEVGELVAPSPGALFEDSLSNVELFSSYG